MLYEKFSAFNCGNCLDTIRIWFNENREILAKVFLKNIFIDSRERGRGRER